MSQQIQLKDAVLDLTWALSKGAQSGLTDHLSACIEVVLHELSQKRHEVTVAELIAEVEADRWFSMSADIKSFVAHIREKRAQK